MLVISQKQMKIFQNTEIRKFEDRMLEHLRKVFPEETDAIKDNELLKLIQAGINNAQKYEMEMEWDIRRYIECSFLYGWDFDKNKKTEWAINILEDKSIGTREKMDKVGIKF